MTVKEMYESIDESRETLGYLINRAKLERLMQGRVSRRTKNKIVDELSRERQLQRDISKKLSYQKIIGFSLY